MFHLIAEHKACYYQQRYNLPNWKEVLLHLASIVLFTWKGIKIGDQRDTCRPWNVFSSERVMETLKCVLSEREMFFNSPWNVLEMFLIRESFAASLKSSCGAPLATAVHCGSMASFPGTDTKCIQAILVVGGNWSRAPQSNPIKVYFLLFSGRKEWVAQVPRIYWPRQCNQAPSGIELLFTFCKTV